MGQPHAARRIVPMQEGPQWRCRLPGRKGIGRGHQLDANTALRIVDLPEIQIVKIMATQPGLGEPFGKTVFGEMRVAPPCRLGDAVDSRVRDEDTACRRFRIIKRGLHEGVAKCLRKHTGTDMRGHFQPGQADRPRGRIMRGFSGGDEIPGIIRQGFERDARHPAPFYPLRSRLVRMPA